MSYLDDVTYRVLKDGYNVSYPVRKTLKFINGYLIDDPKNDQTLIVSYGNGSQNLAVTCGIGSDAYSQINNLYDPVLDLDAVNLKTLKQYFYAETLSQVLTNGNNSLGRHINFTNGSYMYSSDGFVSINDTLNMLTHRITGLVLVPIGDSEAASKYYVDQLLNPTLADVLTNGNIANMAIDMSDNKITDLALCTQDQDAANKWYVDQRIGTSIYEQIQCVVYPPGFEYDPLEPGDYVGGGRAYVGKTFFYYSMDTLCGPYIITDDTLGAVKALRHNSWVYSARKDMSKRHIWPIMNGQDIASRGGFIFTTTTTGTITVGVAAVGWSSTFPEDGAGYRTHIDHPACAVHATMNVDIFACPPIIDGIEFGYAAGDTRIFLSKQTVTKENGPWKLGTWNPENSTWELSRPIDWNGKCYLRAGTTHRFHIMSGTLFPEHIVNVYIGSNMYIYEYSGPSVIIGDWFCTLTTVPDVDAVEGTIVVDEDWEYVPRGCSATSRKSVRVTGHIEAGEDYRAGIFEGPEYLMPLDVDPDFGVKIIGNHDAFGAIDDIGGMWTVYSSSDYVYRDTTIKNQGTASWRLQCGSGYGFTYLRKLFTLPANHRAGLRLMVRKSSAMGSNVFGVFVGATELEWWESGSPYELSHTIITNSTTWSTLDIPISATTDPRTISLAIWADTTGLPDNTDIGNIDAVQFTHTIDNFSSRLYIDAEYGPASDPRCMYYPDDTQEEQIDDSSNQLGGPTLCGLDMDTNCRLFMPSLGIERNYAFSISMTPISEVVTDPGLPEDTTLPSYPYD